MREAGENRARSKLAATAEEHLPEIAVNLSVAALIWLFGVLVFLPTAIRIGPAGLPVLCSLTILSAFSAFLIKGSRGLREVLDAASGVLAYEWMRRRKGREKKEDLVERTKSRISVALHIATIVIVYLLYSPLLKTIHPSINGLALILTILVVLWTLFIKSL